MPPSVRLLRQGKVERMDEWFGSFGMALAIVVISSLLASTLLSLVMVPVIFALMDNLVQWF